MKGLIATVSLLACIIGVRAATQVKGARFDELQLDNERIASSSLIRKTRDTANNECGQRGPVYNALIAGGEDATFGEFPWHVGIYRTVVNKPHEQDCGGTLVSRTIVITAAHCFWEDALRKLKPHTLYKIAAGKYFRAWSQQEEETQIRDVAQIHVPKRFRGRRSNFQYDIAVVQLATGVDFTATVKPICIDWSKRYDGVQLSPGTKGTVVGWGVTLDDTASDVLQKIDLPFADFDTCFNALPEDAKHLYTDDKFCAGYTNKSRSVCSGDSGGGLVFNHTNDRYYLRGVVSVSFKPPANRDPCYSQQYTGFTLVSQYLPWIKPYVDAEKTSSGSVTQEPPKKKSKSEEMCDKYASAVYDSVELPSAGPIKLSTCAMSPRGISAQRLLSQPREFPHMAALGYLQSGEISYKCNGNLVSEWFVLIAAHCSTAGISKSIKLTSVRLGTVNLKENNTSPGFKEIEVEKQFVHPEYKKGNAYNDVALLKLKEAVTFNGYVRPACLDPYPSLLNQDVVTAASWGRVSLSTYGFYENLQQGDLRISDTNQCDQKYVGAAGRDSVIPNGITAETMLCFSPLDDSIECSLSSGSPLMVKLSEPFCMYRIVGIVTFGQAGQCVPGIERVPTIAMRVSPYIRWIESIVWPEAEDVATDSVPSLPPRISEAGTDNARPGPTRRPSTGKKPATTTLGPFEFPE